MFDNSNDMWLPVFHSKSWCLLHGVCLLKDAKNKEQANPLCAIPSVLFMGLSLFCPTPSILSLVYMSADTAVEPEIQAISFSGVKSLALCIGGEGCR